MGILKSIRKNSKKQLKKVEAEVKKAEATARKYSRDEAKADLRIAQLLDKACLLYTSDAADDTASV